MLNNVIPVLLILICSISLFGQETKIMPLIENDDIKLDLLYKSEANISMPDWIQLKLRNKTSRNIYLKNYSYSINTIDQNSDEENKFKKGALGQSKMYKLIDYYCDINNSNDTERVFTLEPKKEIIAWQYLSNTASAILDSEIIKIKEVCALMEVEVDYGFQKDLYDNAYAEEAFCFSWTNSTLVDPELIQNNLESKISEVKKRNINAAILSTLLLNSEVINKMTIDTLIYGIKVRSRTDHKAERLALLKALKAKDGFNHPKIIEHYKTCMQDKECNWVDDLKFYWNNELFDKLISNKLFINEKVKILEYHNEEWKNDERKRTQFLNHLLTKIEFKFNEVPTQEDFKKWYYKIKLLASTRHQRVITYLETLIENETFLKIEDWSGQMNKKVFTNKDKPKFINIRICDVAYVGLLRALNKVEIQKEFKGFQYNQSVIINKEWRGFDESQKGSARLKNPYTILPINLNMAEKFYYLNHELRMKIRKSIRRLGY